MKENHIVCHPMSHPTCRTKIAYDMLHQLVGPCVTGIRNRYKISKREMFKILSVPKRESVYVYTPCLMHDTHIFKIDLIDGKKLAKIIVQNNI